MPAKLPWRDLADGRRILVNPDAPPVRHCARSECGLPIPANRPRAETCSPSCRQLLWRATRFEAPPRRRCKQCPNLLPKRVQRNRRYCSDRCRAAAAYAARVARTA